MKKTTFFIIVLAIIAAAFTGYSYLNLRSKTTSEISNDKIDRAEVTYKKIKDFFEKGERGKAEETTFFLFERYKTSPYTEKALIELADTYFTEEDFSGASNIYSMVFSAYPESLRKEELKKKIEDINMRLMQNQPQKEEFVIYVVQVGDSLSKIAKNHNTTVELIKNMNGLTSDLIRIGQKLKVNVAEFSILADKSENILTLKKNGIPFKTYKIATGRENGTPVGTFVITEKLIKPIWTKPGVGIVMPDDPEYELGERWMAISIKGYGIHGTNDESSIGKQSTSGCIRMKNEEVIELYDIVPAGTSVEIVD